MSLFRHHGIDTTLASTFDDDLTNTINWYAKNNDWWD
jgi:dTDP-D-glucose 4,6-dehydratase